MTDDRGSQVQEETLRELAEIVWVGNLLLDRAQRISQSLHQQVRQAMKDQLRRQEQASVAHSPTPPGRQVA